MKMLTGLKAFAAVALIGGAAQAADFVVIQSNNAGVAAGDVISDSATLSLASGASVTLLSAAGETVEISGPFEGKPEAKSGGGDGAFAVAISNMLKSRQKSTASLGAVRSGTAAEEEQVVPLPWLISLENSGDRCIYGQDVGFWRAGADAATFSIKGGVKSLNDRQWPAGTDRVRLPAKFADELFVDGGAYTATVDGRAVELRVHKAAATLSNPAELAAWMAQKGCTNQALALLNTLQ